jgi:hypothetical protein
LLGWEKLNAMILGYHETVRNGQQVFLVHHKLIFKALLPKIFPLNEINNGHFHFFTQKRRNFHDKATILNAEKERNCSDITKVDNIFVRAADE